MSLSPIDRDFVYRPTLHEDILKPLAEDGRYIVWRGGVIFRRLSVGKLRALSTHMNSGHRYVSLRLDGRLTTRKVANLVYDHFGDPEAPRESGLVVHHLDGDVDNNDIHNLTLRRRVTRTADPNAALVSLERLAVFGLMAIKHLQAYHGEEKANARILSLRGVLQDSFDPARPPRV